MNHAAGGLTNQSPARRLQPAPRRVTGLRAAGGRMEGSVCYLWSKTAADYPLPEEVRYVAKRKKLSPRAFAFSPRSWLLDGDLESWLH